MRERERERVEREREREREREKERGSLMKLVMLFSLLLMNMVQWGVSLI